MNNRLGVISEFYCALCAFSSVKCYIDDIVQIFMWKTGLVIIQSWSLALNSLFIDNGRVHVVCLVENTLGFAKAHIDKMVSFDRDLCSSVRWPASRLDCRDDWSFII